MSERHQRVASLLTELAARFVQQEANTNPLITVTHVDVSSDFKHATIYFTTIPEGKEDDATIFLKRQAGAFRTFLKKKSKLKFIPHIEFTVDRGERHRQHIDTISHHIESEK